MIEPSARAAGLKASQHNYNTMHAKGRRPGVGVVLESTDWYDVDRCWAVGARRVWGGGVRQKMGIFICAESELSQGPRGGPADRRLHGWRLIDVERGVTGGDEGVPIHVLCVCACVSPRDTRCCPAPIGYYNESGQPAHQ